MADMRTASRYDIAGQAAMPSPREAKLVEDIMHDFAELQTYRNTTATQWEEVSELILPNYRNTFMYGNYNWPGQKKTERQVDATGMMALSRFAAICDSLLTPRNMIWHQLEVDDETLMKDRQIKLWLHDATMRMFKARYSPIANFAANNQQVYQSLGAFGTAPMFVDQAVDEAGNPQRALRYKAIPLGEMFIMENHQGLVNGFIRWFRLNARQAKEKWPGKPLPPSVQSAFDVGSLTMFNFLHHVIPNKDRDPNRLDAKGMKFSSTYLSIEGKCIMQEGGYKSFPVSASRYEQAPGEVYGRSPAMMVLPALKTLNAEKRMFLKAGHRAADPVLLTYDDGLVDFSMRPGALNKGGVNAEGKRLIDTLPVGELQITKEMMDEERSLINDAFLVSLFQILTETPQMTATEVIERTNEKGILIAPSMGRQGSEYLGTMIPRELDLMVQMGMLDPMPQKLAEAFNASQTKMHIRYTSPLSRAMEAQEAAGFIRSIETTKELVAVTQDQSLLDVYDMDVAQAAMARIQGTPEPWLASPGAIAQKRQARAQALAKQQQIQAAPAAAALIKAQAAAGGATPTAAPMAPQQPLGQQGQQ